MVGLWLLLLLSSGGTLLSTDPRTGNTTDPNNKGSLQSCKGRDREWSPAHGQQTALNKGWCSTWGAGHFSTFDHHAFDFLGTCNYIFAASCKDASPTFSVQLRQGADRNISRIIVELGSSVVTVNETTISIKDIGVVSLPYTRNGLQITPYGQSVQLVAKQLELELVVMWGPDPHLMVLVERKYMGQMCGLCGNFDGKAANEFLSEDGKLLEPYQYAALQKLDDPNEICTYEAIPRPPVLQAEHVGICTQLLTLVSPECDVPKEPLVLSCQADMAVCAQPGQQNCSCTTLSEYSRRCSMAHKPVRDWRHPSLCPAGQCPANQVYQECGTACVRTCSNPQHSCASSCTSGCFCPEGMVLDDLSNNHTCVPVSQCPCMLNGVVYGSGKVTRAACQSCQCTMGRWTCTGQPCPGHCSLEGGSFVTTFDARPYRFHGTCTYILLQSPLLPSEGTLMAVYDKSGYSHSETSLVAIVYLSRQGKIMISEDDVTNNGDPKWLPYQTRNITIFRQTSTHIQMATTFGLQLVVQQQPIFQAYITVEPHFRGQTRGLCGNFNGDTTDEFTSSTGISEGTAALFVDSWRAGNCPAALEREIDPCSMSQLNKVCAETHCSVLLKKGTVFERCHAVVDPKPFYKRCVYQACNYEETFPHICAALGAYAHACSSQDVLLWGWRDSVDNCTVSCTGNRTFSQDSQACDRTCLSLSNREPECHTSPVPVDGCNCPEGTYLDHRNECVHKAQCPCMLESHKFILAGQSTMVNGFICYCIDGWLSCPEQSQVFLASCPAPKTFQSCSQSSEDKFGAACAPTCQRLATGIACVLTKCEAGCVCPEGFYENTDGQCVPPEQCPCDFAGVSYPGGAELHTNCKNCTCSQGRWTCQQSAHCPSTCTLYGEGHIVTFDGKRFIFDGNCEYTLATDDCGGSNPQPSFKILMENVICGKSGVTCSRVIKIVLGGLTITMADRNYTIDGENSQVHLQVKPSSLNLVLDVGIPGRLTMTLVWNKHTSVSITIHRDTQDALCGLCGNCNGNMKDDFETRSKYVASSELEFVNSWKESPLCRDTSYAEDPCSLNAFLRPWAERKCSIINSPTFAACHSKVYRMPYYEACVHDACSCEEVGDCKCLCDAVAAYAKACLDKGVCVDWRTPDFCPIYCDFYNSHVQAGDGAFQHTQEANCTWHYQPCLCPGQLDSFLDTNIEGCYNCSQDEYFDHSEGTCVPCMLPNTTLPLLPTTGAPPTQVQPSTGTSSTISPGPTFPPTAPASTEERTLLTTWMPSPVSTGATWRSTATGLTVTQATTQSTASSASTGTTSTAQSTAKTTKAPISSVTETLPNQGTAVHEQGLATTTGTETSHTGPPATLRSTTLTQHALQGTGRSTAIKTTLPTANTEKSTRPPEHTVYTHHTSTMALSTAPTPRGPPGTSRKAPTTAHTEGALTHTSGEPRSSPQHPWTSQGSHARNPSTTAQSSPPRAGTTLRTTPFETSARPQTSTTSLVHTLGTTGLTTTSESTSTRASTRGHWATSTQTPMTSSSLTTTLRATGPTPSTPVITKTNTASTQAPSSLTTAKTSLPPQSHTFATSLRPSTSPTVTTTVETGSPQARTSKTTQSTPQTPWSSQSANTTSVSTTAHTSLLLTGTSLRTTGNFSVLAGAHTSMTSLVPTESTSALTTKSESLTNTSSATPLWETTMPRTVISSLLTTTLKATGSTPTTPVITKTNTASTQATGSLTTAKTSLPPQSHTFATSLQPSTSPTVTTTVQTGSPQARTSKATQSTPQTPWSFQSANTTSVSITAHTSLPLTGTSLRTTGNFSVLAGAHTFMTSLVPAESTSALTTKSESLTNRSSATPLWETTMPRKVISSLLTTTLRATGPTPSTPVITKTNTASTQATGSLTTAKTSLPPQSHTFATSLQPSTSPTVTTTVQTGSPQARTSKATQSTPQTPWSSQSANTTSVSTTAHTSLPLTGTSLRTTGNFSVLAGAHTFMTSLVPAESTSALTTKSESLRNFSSATPLWETSMPRTVISSLLTTTLRATGPTPSTPVITKTNTASTQATGSLTTAKTSLPPQSHTFATSLQPSTSPTVTTTVETGSPQARTSKTTQSTPQTPWSSQSANTTSVSTTAHTSLLLTGMSLRTTGNFSVLAGAHTSMTSLVPTQSTSALTTKSESLRNLSSATPLWETTMPRTVISSLLTTTLKATGSTPSTSVITKTNTASTQAPSSLTTAKTSLPPQSHTFATSLQPSTSPTVTTTVETGSPQARTSKATQSTPQTPWSSQSANTTSVSTTAHTSLPLTGTSLRTTGNFSVLAGAHTSMTSLVPTESTSALTTKSESLRNLSSATPLWETTMPRTVISSLLTTTLRATGPTPSTPVITKTNTASTQATGSLTTAKTSLPPQSHTFATSLQPSTSPTVTTTVQTGSPQARTSKATQSTPQTPWSSQSANTTSVSTTAHTSLPLTGMSLRTTGNFSVLAGAHTSMTSLVPTQSTSALTTKSESLRNLSSATPLWETTMPRTVISSLLTTTLSATGPTPSTPVITKTNTASTQAPSSLTTAKTSLPPQSHTFATSLQPSTSPTVTTTVETGSPQARTSKATQSTPQTPWSSQSANTTSVSTTAHTSLPLTGMSLRTTGNFSVLAGAHTSMTSLVPTQSTSALTTKSESLTNTSSATPLWETTMPRTVISSLLTTTLRATGPTPSTPVITKTNTASTQAPSSLTTAKTSLPPQSHTFATSLQPSTSPTVTTTVETGSPQARTSKATQSTPQTPWSSQSANTTSVSTTAHTSLPLTGTSLRTTGNFSVLAGAHTSMTSLVPTQSTSALTTKSESLRNLSSATRLWETTMPRTVISSLLTTTLRATGPTPSTPVITKTNTASTQAPSSLTTAKTSLPPQSHTFATSLQPSTSPTVTTTVQTGSPQARTSKATQSTPQTPWSSQSANTTSVSTTAHTSLPLTGTSLRTTGNFSVLAGAHTSMPSLVPTQSTSALTTKSESLTNRSSATPLWETTMPRTVISSLLTTTLKATGPTPSTPVITKTNTASTQAPSSLTTAKTSLPPQSHTFATSLQPSTSPTVTTTVETGSPQARTSKATQSTPQTPWSSQSANTTSVSITAHTSLPLTGMSLRTTGNFSVLAGAHTSMTSLVPTQSTSALTTKSESLRNLSSATPLWETTMPRTVISSLLTTTLRATGPTPSTPVITKTNTASTQAPSSLTTAKTSLPPQSHTFATSLQPSTSPTVTTTVQTGSPQARTSKATQSTPQTPWSSQSANTTSVSTTAHTSLPLTGTSLRTTGNFSVLAGAHTSMTSLVPTQSTSALTTKSESLTNRSSATPLWETTMPRTVISSLLTTTLKATGSTPSTPVITKTNTASTQAPSSLTTAKTSLPPQSHTFATSLQPSTSPTVTTTVETGSPQARTSKATQSTPQTPWSSQSANTTSVSITAHTSLPLTGTSLRTTGNFSVLAGAHTSMTSLVPTQSTSALTTKSESLTNRSSATPLWETTMPRTVISSLLTTTLKATGSTPSTPVITKTNTASTQAPSSLTTAKTSLPPQSHTFATSVQPSTSPTVTTTVETGSPQARTSKATQSTPQTPWSSQSANTTSVSITAHTSLPLTGMSLRTTGNFSVLAGAHTSMTSLVPTQSTSALTTKSESLRNLSSATPLWETTMPRTVISSLLTTTLRATGPTPSTPVITKTNTASTQAPSSLTTAKTSLPPQSHTFATSLQPSTSPTVTTTVETGSPQARTSKATQSTPQTPWSSQSANTTSVSTTAHTSLPLTGTSLRTTGNFSVLAGAHTSMTSLVPTESTSALTTKSESLRNLSSATPLWETTMPRTVISSLLTTTLRATGPTPSTPVITKTNTASTQAPSSLTTAKTSLPPQSHTFATSLQPSTSPTVTTTVETGSPQARTSKATHSTPQTPWSSQSANTTSVSTTAHTSLPLTGTSLRTTGNFSVLAGAHTSMTSLVPTESTSALTTKSESLRNLSSATPLWETTMPRTVISSLLTTTLRATGPTPSTPVITKTNTASTQATGSLTTAKTSLPPQSHTFATSLQPSTSPTVTTTVETGSPQARTSKATQSTPQTPWSSQSANTTFVSITAHTSLPLTGTSLRTTGNFSVLAGAHTSMTSLVPTQSTSALTTKSESLTNRSSATPLWETTMPRTVISSLLTTTLKATGSTPSTPVITKTNTASTQAPSSLTTAKTSLPPQSHTFATSLQPSTSPTVTTTVETGSPQARTSKATQSTPQTPWSSQSANTTSVSTTAHTPLLLTGTSLRTTGNFSVLAGAHTSMTSLVPTQSTSALTTKSESLRNFSSATPLWETTMPRTVISSLLTTTLRATGSTPTTPVITKTNTASTQATGSLTTAKTSLPPQSHTFATSLQPSTSPTVTTTVETGSPQARTSKATQSTPQTPWSSQSANTTSVSTTAHTSLPLTGTSLRTTGNFSVLAGAHTSMTSLVPTQSTSALTTKSESLRNLSSATPLWETTMPRTVISSLLTTTLRATGPTPSTPVITKTNTASTQAPSSLTTAKTSLPPQSHTFATSLQPSTSPTVTTTVETGSPQARTSKATQSTPQTPWSSQSANTTSVSTTAHTSLPLTGTSLRTTGNFSVLAGAHTSMTSLVPTESTSALTTKSESLRNLSSATPLWETTMPRTVISSLLTTTLRATGPTPSTPVITKTNTASTQAPSSLTTAKTSLPPQSHTFATSLQPSTSPTVTTTVETGSPQARTSKATQSTPQTPWSSQSANTTSVSTTAHTSLPLTGTSLRTTGNFSVLAGAHTSMTSLVPTESTSALTTKSESLRNLSSATPLWETTMPRTVISSLLTTTLRATGPTPSTPVITKTNTASTQATGSLTTAKTSLPPQSHTFATSLQPSTSPTVTTTVETGSPQARTSKATQSTPQTPWSSQSANTTFVSITAHTSLPLTGTSLRTTGNFSVLAGAHTSMTSLVPTQSTSALTTKSESLTNRSSATPLWETTMPRTVISSLLTTTLKATGSTPSTPVITKTNTASTQAPSSLTTAKTSLPPQSHTFATSLQPSTSPTVTTTVETGSPQARTSKATQSTPQTPWSSQSANTTSVSTTAHTPLLLTGTSLRTTGNFSVLAGAHTSMTSLVPTQSTSALTTKSESLRNFSSATPLWETTMPRTVISSLLTTTLRATGSTPTTPVITKTNTASTQATGSLTTAKTSLPPQSHTFATSLQPSTSPTVTTTVETGSPQARTSKATQSTPQTPWSSQSANTTSVSTTAHTSLPLTGTSLRTTGNFSVLAGAHTFMTSLVPAESTSALTTKSESLTNRSSATPLWETTMPRTVISSLLTTTLKATGPTPSTPVITKTNTASTQAPSSLTTAKTSLPPQSHTFATSLQPSTSPTVTTTVETGSPQARTSKATQSTPQTPWSSQSANTTSVSTTAHTSLPLTGMSLRTTGNFSVLAGAHTSMTSLVPTQSTSALTTKSESLRNFSSATPLWETTMPRTVISSLLTTTFKATGPTPNTPLMTSSTSASFQSQSTSRTSPVSSSLGSSSSISPYVSISKSPFFSPVTSLSHFPRLSTSVFPSTPSMLSSKSSSISSLSTTQTSSSFISTMFPSSSSLISSPSSVPPTTTVGSSQYSPTSRFLSSPAASPGVTSRSHSTSPSSFLSPTPASTPANSSLLPPFTSHVSPSDLPTLPAVHMSPRPPEVPYSNPNFPSTSHTTPSASPSSAFSQSTTSQFTSLTTQASMLDLVSSSLAMTASTIPPTTNFTTSPPGTTRLPTSVFLSSHITSSGSSSTFPPASSSTAAPLVSSPGPCSVQEHEQEITYQGCTANVTLTRCEGVCASSASFNITTQQVDAQCSCCSPLGSYEKQLLLPCPDPNTAGQQLTLTLQVFSHCVCKPSCRD